MKINHKERKESKERRPGEGKGATEGTEWGGRHRTGAENALKGQEIPAQGETLGLVLRDISTL